MSMLKVSNIRLHHYNIMAKITNLYTFLYGIRHTKFNNQITTGTEINLFNGLVGFNCQPGYYVYEKDEFAKYLYPFR